MARNAGWREARDLDRSARLLSLLALNPKHRTLRNAIDTSLDAWEALATKDREPAAV
jgi:hypothetical protein